MMSKERELLQAIILKVDGLEGFGIMNIIKESKELLAQPEQEPLSDEIIWQGLAKEGIPDYKAMTFIKGIKFAEREHKIRGDDE